MKRVAIEVFKILWKPMLKEKQKLYVKFKKKKKNATYRNLKNAITAYKNSNNKNKFTQESLKLLMAF